jgi:hypothetical protein
LGQFPLADGRITFYQLQYLVAVFIGQHDDGACLCVQELNAV